MKELTAICKSIWYMFLALTTSLFAIHICFPMLEEYIDKYETAEIIFKGFDIIKLSFILFGVTFFGIAAICFIIKTLYNLWLFFYYSFFYNDSYTKVQVNVDENNIIRDSYLEFRNGDRVPLHITKIVGSSSDITEVKNEEESSCENEGEEK